MFKCIRTCIYRQDLITNYIFKYMHAYSLLEIIDEKIINSKHIEPIYIVCNKWLGDFLKNKGNELRTRSTL